MKNCCNGKIFVEAEGFKDYGGWSLDSQFTESMGSSYLLAHGFGVPVDDAVTDICVSQAGEYNVWVRTKDWVPEYHPGRFELLINGARIGTELGANGKDWSWDQIGTVSLAIGSTELRLHDLTGFEGRIDAVYLTMDEDTPPEEGKAVSHAWRRELLGISDASKTVSHYNVVVVGGGVSGCAAAISAARNGCKVALINDRPVLGGNASREIGLGPRGYKEGSIVQPMLERMENGDLRATQMVEDEENITVYLNEKLFSAETADGHVISVDTRNTKSNCEQRICAEVFIDASGVAALAKLAGAEIRTGREGKDEFQESLAPDKSDELHHGNTILYHLHRADHPVPVPEMPWATAISKNFGDLGGQMGGLSMDNKPGPNVNGDGEEGYKRRKLRHAPSLVTSVQFKARLPEDIMEWFPATHFWEYGQNMDLIQDAEEIRDHLMRALYGTYYNVKTAQPEKYASLEFDWMRIVPAQGEFCRIVGDYILNENEVREHAEFPDAVALNDSAFCVHYPGNVDYDFRLKSWTWDFRDYKPYYIPFRCLYSKNIDNLMMAGKIISVSRVVGTNTKLMANGAQHGVAVGCAAELCVKYGISPRQLGQEHLGELKELIGKYSWYAVGPKGLAAMMELAK